MWPLNLALLDAKISILGAVSSGVDHLAFNPGSGVRIPHISLLINVASDLMKGEVLKERAAGAIPLIAQITNEALLSLVEAHQDRQNCNPAKRPRWS